MQVDFIMSHSIKYNGSGGGPQAYGVAYSTQTQRLPPAQPSGIAGQMADYHNYVLALGKHRGASSSSAASMTGQRRKKRDNQLEFCDLFPDRCYFAPAPETQGIAGVYHSI